MTARDERRARGERHPKAKADDQDVELARRLHEEHGLGYGEISKKFETSRSTVRDWCTYRRR